MVQATWYGMLYWVLRVARLYGGWEVSNVKIEENRKLVSRTREEIARDYALKEEVDKDLDKIMSRFDRVESKLDNLMERIIK